MQRTEEFAKNVYTNHSKSSIYLTGSYAMNQYTSRSDIDILIIVDGRDKDRVIKDSAKLLKFDFPDLQPILDCKVISRKECISNNANYLFLLSSLHEGKPLTPNTFSIKIVPDRLKQHVHSLSETLAQLEHDIHSQRNHDVIAFSLWSIAKSYLHIDRFIKKKPITTNLKQVLDDNFTYLGRISDKYKVRGIQGKITIALVKRGQRSGNFNRLTIILEKINTYRKEVTTEFYQWYTTMIK